MTDNSIRPDLDAAVAFLDAWCEQESRHLTAIVPDGKSIGRSFAADERKPLSAWIADQLQRGANIYYHVNRPRLQRIGFLDDRPCRWPATRSH
jgi:hypothetical protein